MSDSIKHECGLVFIRLRKPIPYYHKKYGTALYGLNKLRILMEKQRNRGQDGVGVATLKLDADPEYPFLQRARCNSNDQLADLFKMVFSDIENIKKYRPEMLYLPEIMKWNARFLGEVILGHLRYGTQGRNNIEFCHPFVAYDLKPARNIALAGNFNLVNVKELFAKAGVEPGELNAESDLAAMLEIFKYFMAEMSEDQADVDLPKLLKQAAPLFDGGYHLGGILGTGDGFVMRDPMGIRPSYYYVDEEVVVAASERAAIQTAFGLATEQVKELEPGYALIVRKSGEILHEEIVAPGERKACSFEHIYFSRGNDTEIYHERLSLGYHLARRILEAVDYDVEHTVFSYIPNTAEVAFYGLMQGVEEHLNHLKKKEILERGRKMSRGELLRLLSFHPRMEKIVLKDVKMRTFITEDASRNEMVKHVYDVTYGALTPGEDTLVVIDDSIVRGTTLRESILKILDRLHPKRIIIVSSAPQIRYPDCYGIDMSKMGDFIAFRAAMNLLQEREQMHVLNDVYQLCRNLKETGALETRNAVRLIYENMDADEVSHQVARLVTSPDIHAQVDVIYQSVEHLHESCPANLGDWYFTGNYPTLSGNRVVNNAFLNFMEDRNERGY